VPTQDELPWRHSNRYGADSACKHCDGIIRHECWCATENANVRYAFTAAFDSDHLSRGDELILHALGVTWKAAGSRRTCGALKPKPKTLQSLSTNGSSCPGTGTDA
jgi:hypothetical protein